MNLDIEIEGFVWQKWQNSRKWLRIVGVGALFYSVLSGCTPGPQPQPKREKIAPGVVHEHYLTKVPISIHVLKVDLQNPGLRMVSVKAKDRLAGRATISQMVAGQANRKVLAAVNANFFEADGRTLGLQVVDGEIVHLPNPEPAFAILESGKPFIGKFQFSGQVQYRQTLPIAGVNRGRLDNELILYNHFWGDSTRTNKWGAEVSVKPVDAIQINRPFKATIMTVDTSLGNQPILSDQYVLSAHGKPAQLLGKLGIVGDTLELLLTLQPLKEPIVQAICGMPRLVRDGKINIETNRSNRDVFVATRQPRTAIGVNKSRKTLYIVTVDGRQSDYSVGMTLSELADFMIKLGVNDGLNLDGGSSTTLWLKGKVVNRPSDFQAERPVANALMIIKNE